MKLYYRFQMQIVLIFTIVSTTHIAMTAVVNNHTMLFLKLHKSKQVFTISVASAASVLLRGTFKILNVFANPMTNENKFSQFL